MKLSLPTTNPPADFNEFRLRKILVRHALTEALVLGLTAITDAEEDEATTLVAFFSGHCADQEIAACKSLAERALMARLQIAEGRIGGVQ